MKEEFPNKIYCWKNGVTKLVGEWSIKDSNRNTEIYIKKSVLAEKIKKRIRIEKRDRTFGHNIYSKALEWVLSEINKLKEGE